MIPIPGSTFSKGRASKRMTALLDVFDHLIDSVFITDQHRRLVYANESFRNLIDLPARALASNEDVAKYIEVPEACWAVYRDEGVRGKHREVDFVATNGVAGRMQLFGELFDAPTLGPGPLFVFIGRDVSVEHRLHQKYKVQIENNNRLIRELQKNLKDASFLKRLALDVPYHSDASALREMILERMKSELNFRDANFFRFAEDGSKKLIPMGPNFRVGARLREAAQYVAEEFSKETLDKNASSYCIEYFGTFWVAVIRPRLEKPIIFIAGTAEDKLEVDHTSFMDAFALQVATLIDNQSLHQVSITDALTGLYNRRFFDSLLKIECSKALEQQTELSLILIDIDFFKQVNDTHGHPTGDAVISMIGRVLRNRIRTSDLTARLGGEEFAIFLPDTSATGAVVLADDLRRLVSESVVASPESGKEVSVTISCGIASFSREIGTPEGLYQAADEALYLAKKSGRNCTITHGLRIVVPKAV